MSGYVGDLSDSQEKSLSKFREIVQDLQLPEHSDHYLLRWLRAREFSLEKSEMMIRRSMDSRQRWGLDTILETFKPSEVLTKYYPGGFFGFDKEGAPVFIDPIGQIDFKGLLYSSKKEEIIRLKAYVGEFAIKLCKEQSEKLGKHMEQMVVVMDLEGLGLKHLWKPGVVMFNNIVTFYEDNFPELMKHIFVIRAPKIFPLAYSLVKPFLSEATRSKVKILSADWKNELLEFIDGSNLPEFYGGTCRDPDGNPKCSSKICYGGEVPEKYFLVGQTAFKPEDFQSAHVKWGASLKIEYKVEQPGAILSWEFKTEEHDIGFGVYYKSPDDVRKHIHTSDLEEVFPMMRRDCHMIPEQGSLTCERLGTYVMKFDNSYSWTRSKKIYYDIELTQPLCSGVNNGKCSTGTQHGSVVSDS